MPGNRTRCIPEQEFPWLGSLKTVHAWCKVEQETCILLLRLEEVGGRGDMRRGRKVYEMFGRGGACQQWMENVGGAHHKHFVSVDCVITSSWTCFAAATVF